MHKVCAVAPCFPGEESGPADKNDPRAHDAPGVCEQGLLIMATEQKPQNHAFKETALEITSAAGPSSLEHSISQSVARDLADMFNTAGFNQLRGQLEMSVREGNLTGTQVGVRLSGAGQAEMDRRDKEKKSKRSADDLFYLALIDRIHDDLDALRADIKALEGEFERKYGDAWRESLALEILGDDLFPERSPGESMEDYRERVEKLMIAELLDESGQIKAEYKDHPRYGRPAQWAYQQNIDDIATRNVAVLEDPNASAEQIEEAKANIEKSGLSGVVKAQRKAEPEIAQELNAVSEKIDGNLSEAPVTTAALDAFKL